MPQIYTIHQLENLAKAYCLHLDECKGLYPLP